MAWPVGLRSDPLFLRAVSCGGQAPIIFRPFLAPNAHRKPRHCSTLVLRIAADLDTPLARGRSALVMPAAFFFLGSWDLLLLGSGCALRHAGVLLVSWF
jgi:hypothetical protein